MFRIFLVQPDGEVSGAVGRGYPSRKDAERAAEVWRESHGYLHTYEVYYTDEAGRIRIPPA